MCPSRYVQLLAVDVRASSWCPRVPILRNLDATMHLGAIAATIARNVCPVPFTLLFRFVIAWAVFALTDVDVADH